MTAGRPLRRWTAQLPTAAWALIASLGLTVAGVTPSKATDPLPLPSDADCLTCHSDPELAGEDAEGREISVFVDPEIFARSVHADLSCVGCHTDVTSTDHPPALGRVACATCHAETDTEVRESGHGPGQLPGAEACVACHRDPHQILAAADTASPIYRTHIPGQCATCHDRPEPPHVALADPIGTYARTIHGRALLERGNLAAATCTDCHTAHSIRRAADPASSVHRAAIAATCEQCHADVAVMYRESIHGQTIQHGDLEAATCTDCHGEHTILSPEDPASTVFSTTISRETCASCHGAKRLAEKFGLGTRQVETYRESYHGLAAEMGVTTVANCASCHGIHDIFPSSDPRSTVHPANIPVTCGKCHAGVSSAVLSGLTIHGGEEGSVAAVRWAGRLYRIAIPLVIGAMVIHHGLDFLRKLRRHRQRRAPSHPVARWSGVERAEHWLLLIAFAALAYSGFAIRYPHAAWAAPFHWLGGESFRRGFHRTFALVFVILGIFHLVRATLTRRGRRMLAGLAFRAADLVHLRHFVTGALPSLPESHEPARFTYMAKVEYWALVWGSVIMTLTGMALVFMNWTLRHLPGWMPDFCRSVHFYEAVLATLAILVWHLYRVVFDPDVYPLDLAMSSHQGSAASRAPKRGGGSHRRAP
jgi:cytochrome b subunit of formate dehydrogenase